MATYVYLLKRHAVRLTKALEVFHQERAELFSSIHDTRFKRKSVWNLSPVRRRIPCKHFTLVVTLGTIDLAHYKKAVRIF